MRHSLHALKGCKDHTLRTCTLRVLEWRNCLPADNPLSRRGGCLDMCCQVLLHFSLRGVIGNTRVTLKLHAAH